MIFEKGVFIEKITYKFLSFGRNCIGIRENEGICAAQDAKRRVAAVDFALKILNSVKPQKWLHLHKWLKIAVCDVSWFGKVQ